MTTYIAPDTDAGSNYSATIYSSDQEVIIKVSHHTDRWSLKEAIQLRAALDIEIAKIAAVR